MKITTIEVELAKALFQVHGVDVHEKAGPRKQLKRKDVVSFGCESRAMPEWHGNLWQRALPGEKVLRAGAYGAVDGTAVREAVREVEC